MRVAWRWFSAAQCHPPEYEHRANRRASQHGKDRGLETRQDRCASLADNRAVLSRDIATNVRRIVQRRRGGPVPHSAWNARRPGSGRYQLGARTILERRSAYCMALILLQSKRQTSLKLHQK
jgi:hypothetical protein